MTVRTLNEEETRAISVVTYNAIILARQTMAKWALRKNKPTKDEMLFMAQTLFSVEQAIEAMVKGPSSDGHSLDGSYDMVTKFRARLADELSGA